MHDSGEVHNAMLNRNIKTFIPERTRSGTPNYEPDFDPKVFTYDEEQDNYVCPAGKVLRYSGYRKKDRRKRYTAKKQTVYPAHTENNVMDARKIREQ